MKLDKSRKSKITICPKCKSNDLSSDLSAQSLQKALFSINTNVINAVILECFFQRLNKNITKTNIEKSIND